MRAMNAANGAARVFSSVWLPGRTSGMKFSSAAITREMCLLNRPCLRDFSVWAKRSAASASSPNRYWYCWDDSRRLVLDDWPLRPGMSFMACRSASGMARTPSGSRGRELSAVSGLTSCRRWVVSRIAQHRFAVVLRRLGQTLLLVRGDLRGLPAALGFLILQPGDLVVGIALLGILAVRRRLRRRLALAAPSPGWCARRASPVPPGCSSRPGTLPPATAPPPCRSRNRHSSCWPWARASAAGLGAAAPVPAAARAASRAAAPPCRRARPASAPAAAGAWPRARWGADRTANRPGSPPRTTAPPRRPCGRPRGRPAGRRWSSGETGCPTWTNSDVSRPRAQEGAAGVRCRRCCSRG